jgi:hypothetical protein
MGLLDGIGGFLFGGGSKQGTIDKRMDRDPIGDRWWQKWESVFGDGGVADPQDLYAKAVGALNAAPINLSIGGGPSFAVQPRGAQRQAQAYMGLLAPWMEGGMELERGRYGNTYNNPASTGVIGNLIGGMGKGAGEGLGVGLGKALF